MRHFSALRRQAGLSIVELMVALTIGLVILSGVTVVFVANSNTRKELEKTGRQIENGRYALQTLREDLQMAGYLGTYVPSTTAPTMVAMPDPCSVVPATIDAASVISVQGYDNGAGAPSCVADLKSGTDIVVVRRVSACVAGSTECDSFLNGAPHFQASECAQDTQSYVFGTTAGDFTLRKVNCTAVADIRRYRTHIYFIANNNIGSDGIPTLKRVELGTNIGGTTISFTTVPLVEGIENLQLEYGLDTNNDGIPNVYTANPSTYNTCAGNACVQNWWNAVTVRVNLLARNTQTSVGYRDMNTYTLGLTAGGVANVFGPYADATRRQPYAVTVHLFNPAMRRQ